MLASGLSCQSPLPYLRLFTCIVVVFLTNSHKRLPISKVYFWKAGSHVGCTCISLVFLTSPRKHACLHMSQFLLVKCWSTHVGCTIFVFCNAVTLATACPSILPSLTPVHTCWMHVSFLASDILTINSC